MTRRQFIDRSACAIVAPFLSDTTFGAATGVKSWRMRLSTSSIQYRGLPIEEACRRIAALGFEGIDIWSAYDNCPHLDDVARRLGPDGLAALLEEHRLTLYSFSTYVGGYTRYAQLLGKAGGGVAIQGSAPPCPLAELTKRMKAFLESVKPLVELAEKNHSYLAIENHGQSLLDSVDSFKAFVDLNASPRLGLALAPYHLQAIKASVPEAIKISGSQLFFFYAWQNQPGVQQLPGHGPTEFRPWLQALAQIDYRRFVNPFMHGRIAPDAMDAALRRARDYLREQQSQT